MMKFFSWRCAPAWIAVAHAESVAKARELLLGEVGGLDGSCVVRAKARKAISEDAPEIWTGPNAEFALTDSAEVEEQDAELTRLRAELAAARERIANLTEVLRVAKADCEGIFGYNDRMECLEKIEAALDAARKGGV